jgi:hypothetical protein
LSLRKNRDLVFSCAIEENREHSFLMEMWRPLKFISVIAASDPPHSMIMSIEHP